MSRRIISAVLFMLLSAAIFSCRSAEEKGSFLSGGPWKVNAIRTELPQWLVRWDSSGFEREANAQYFETLTFNDNGSVQVKRYLDVPLRDSGQYFYKSGKWVYDEGMEVLLLELTAGHRQEGDEMNYKAEYRADKVSGDTVRLTRIRVIVKQGDFRDH